MSECPTCNGKGQLDINLSSTKFIRDQLDREIVRYLRQNHIFQRPSCLICVEKHVGEAMEAYQELLKFENSGLDTREAKINWKLNHLSIIGSFRLAADESEKFPILHEILVSSRRAYHYYHLEPNWRRIAEEILNAEEKQKEELQ